MSPVVLTTAKQRRASRERVLDLLSVEEAAEYVGVSKTTIRRWIKEGALKIYRAGWQVRINEADLVEFLHSPKPL